MLVEHFTFASRPVRYASLFSLGLALLALGGCSSSDDTDPISQGRSAVTSYACGSCHDSTAGTFAGQTTPQPGTKAYPQNLTPDMDTGIGEWSEDMIVNAILTGVDDEGAELCSTMKRYGKLGMSEAEARNIAAYLKSLPPVKNAVPESTCAPLKTGDPERDGGK
jgi:mono/diheme cytochrome c family protein